ncbi:hypothetical protein V2G26_002245 [Clonostachys chloroleuca]
MALKTILQTIYTPLGFTKAYSFTLWFIVSGALVGFILARLQFLDIDGRLCPAVPANDGSSGFPAACYWIVHFKRYRVAMILHLATSLPAGLIAVFQFLPAIRHKCILYHRIAGYIAITLGFIGNVGACMLADTAMGGEFSMQTLIGFVAFVTTLTLAMAVYNIKKLQLDGHRAWMIRSWVYMGFVVTLRIIQPIMANIVTKWPSAAKYVAVSCKELHYIYFAGQKLGQGTYTQDSLDKFKADYPPCAEHPLAEKIYVAVQGVLSPDDPGKVNVALMSTFAASGVFAFLLHAVCAEIYIWLTPAENARLREVSYQRQLKRGFPNPGSEGLVAQRFGDAREWLPDTSSESPETQSNEGKAKS